MPENLVVSMLNKGNDYEVQQHSLLYVSLCLLDLEPAKKRQGVYPCLSNQ